MKNYYILSIILIGLCLSISSCEKDKDIDVSDLTIPSISFSENKTSFIVKNGNSLTLKPNVNSKTKCTYQWIIDDKTIATTKDLVYTAKINGLFKLVFKATNTKGESFANIKIIIGCREASSTSSITISKVYDYTPAPGQFINEGYTCKTMEEALIFAEKSLLNKDNYLSLGGFGGYVVMGFDHSIIDNEGMDIKIKGNSFDGSSEPGIIWVMQDENSNGKPDDTWYQLKGSEYDKATTIKNYEVTYTRPSEAGQDVLWTDNQGNNGFIEYLVYHQQDYYYPLWIKENKYTLKGTRLKDKTTKDEETGFYRNNSYDWGYVDNADHLKDGNLFELKNAVDNNGKAIELGFIDFIKVQNAVNVTAGWLGENSTEIFSVEDI